jgi:hypothetical protein
VTPHAIGEVRLGCRVATLRAASDARHGSDAAAPLSRETGLRS